jgi:hypothetical protein
MPSGPQLRHDKMGFKVLMRLICAHVQMNISMNDKRPSNEVRFVIVYILIAVEKPRVATVGAGGIVSRIVASFASWNA